MHRLHERAYRIAARLVPVFAGGLLVAALTSCGVTNNAPASAPTLALTPSSLMLTAGTAGEHGSLLLSGLASGQTASVIISGLPAGVTVSPSSPSLTSGTAMQLLFSAAASAPTAAGTVTFTVNASGRMVTATASISVQAAAPPPQPDFSLSATPDSVELTANGTPAPVSLLITALNGFSSSVRVAITDLPSGVSAQPPSMTLTPGTAAPVSLTASQGAAAGTSTAMLTATSGAITHQIPLTVTVTVPPPPPPDFSIALNPTSLALTQGAAGKTVQLTLTAANGFTGGANVTLAGLPTGVTTAPSDFSITAGTPQTITLTAASTAVTGSSSVIFTAVSGSLSHSATLALSVSVPPPTGIDVTTHHFNNARDGWNRAETVLTPANVNATTFGKIRELPVDGKVDGQPLVVSGLSIGGQQHNVVFAVTEHDSIYAFDADTGTQLWKVTALTSGETVSDDRGCYQISPEIGITDTPVIDRSHGAHGAIFFVAMSKDSSNAYHHRLHALDLTTGAELSGSPSEIQASFPGTGYGSTGGNQVFDPGQYAERVGLLLMNGQIYLGWTSHCDKDPYTGWLMAYSESTLQQTSVLNLTPNGSSSPHFANGEGSIWMAGSGLAGDAQGNIYFLDANGSFDTTFTATGFPASGDFGNSFMKVSTAGNILKPADFFAPYNLVGESDADEDLGSGGALLMPDQTDSNGKIHHLAVGGGKDGNIYVVDRDNMGKFNAFNNNAIYQEAPGATSPIFSMPALFNNTIFYVGNGDHMKAFSFNNALFDTVPIQITNGAFVYPGATPSVSSNGLTNGIVWLIANDSGPGALYAYDATKLSNLLYSSLMAANHRDSFTDNKFITPVIANGKVFIGTTNSVAVFGLLK